MNTARQRVRHLALALAAAAVLFSGAAWSSPAAAPVAGAVGGCGHDPRLDDVDALLEKAFVLIGASTNPGVDPPFGGHDVAARRAINHAREEVTQAIDFAENSCN